MRHFCLVVLLAGYSTAAVCQQTMPGGGYDFENNGKDAAAIPLKLLYNPANNPEGWEAAISGDREQLKEAIKNQYRYLFLQDPSTVHKLQNLHVANDKLKKTVTALLALLEDSLAESAPPRLYQISGEDGKGHVHFTAYFTPVLDVASSPDERYRFPLYRKPAEWNGTPPTRAQIDRNGALRQQGLEIAWSPSLLDNFFMHVQGSGYIRYPNGTLQLLANGGANGHPYTSVGKYLVASGHVPQEAISLESISSWFSHNPDSLENVLFRNNSYTFFAPSDRAPAGASGVALTAGHSIAVDPKYIPLGAILLGKVPILDENGVLLHHEYRLLTAQDRGGAIKGPGHVDLYAGVGGEALKKASAMHHYGALWLILVD